MLIAFGIIYINGFSCLFNESNMVDTMIKIMLPIPDSKLASNKSKGTAWTSGYSLRKKARRDGYYLACAVIPSTEDLFKSTDRLCVIIHTFHKNNKHLDDDNLISALKSYQDGIFDALNQKYGINDKQITLRILHTSERDRLNPRIEWSLSVY